MDERIEREILAAHADRLNAGLEGLAAYPSMTSEQRHALEPLLQLAEQLYKVLVPIDPSPVFVRELGQELALVAARSQLSILERYRKAILVTAATIGSAMAALGLCLLLVPRRRWWAAPFIAVGGMSLTVYTVHVLLLDGVLPRTMEHAYLWHVLVLTTGALVWRRLVGQGPLEWVTQKVARAVARLVVGTPSSTPPPETPAVLP